MSRLLYYMEERVSQKDAFSRELNSPKEVQIVIKKLFRHFKLRPVPIRWTSGNVKPKCSRYYLLINQDWMNFGVICHEVAHLYQFQYEWKLYKGKKHIWHDKKHTRVMKRMVDYCKKKDWFNEELKRRTQPKVVPVKSELEVKQDELIKAQEKVIKYEKKIQFHQNRIKLYQKRLSNAKRGYQMRTRNLKLRRQDD